MKRELQGRYVTVSTTGTEMEAFIPSPLPPNPPIAWSPELRDKFDQALVATGRLDSVSLLLPDTSLFIYMYIRKEALLSSQIEGTQSSLSDLLLFELEAQPGVPMDDVVEVSNYVAAVDYGLKRIADGFPISSRLLREIHKVLLSKGRGSNRTPGRFRRSQNWIGGSQNHPDKAVFVPPPAISVADCMTDLEHFLHDMPERTPTLQKAALAHVQFETIHPFLDGNGRLGRLLITLLLCSEGLLKEPMLYLSLYFKSHRERYYELLNQVRMTGDWETWLDFFAQAVIDTATQAVDTTKRLLALAAEDRASIAKIGGSAGSALRVHQALLQRPLDSPAGIAAKAALASSTVNTCLRHLEDAGIVHEVTGQKRNRIYAYTRYIEVMNEGTEPIE